MRRKIAYSALLLVFLLIVSAGAWLLRRENPTAGTYFLTTTRGDSAVTQGAGDGYPPSLLAGERIDINRATADDLARLPEVGAGLAEDIVRYRAENGDFATAEGLLDVYGMGETTWRGISPYIIVEVTD